MASSAMQLSHTKMREPPAPASRYQRAYTMKMAVTLGLYAALFFVLAFCGPYVLPAITLMTDAPLEDRRIAASQLLLLNDTVWVAIPVVALGAVLFSLLATRRVADALERLGQSARAWASGNLRHRLQFREADRLDDLAREVNKGWSLVGDELDAIRQETSRAREALDRVTQGLSLAGPSGQESLQQLRAAAESLGRIETTIRRFEDHGC